MWSDASAGRSLGTSQTLGRILRRATPEPEDLLLDRELVAAVRALPRLPDRLLDGAEAPFHEGLILDVAQIREMQNRSGLLELLEQQTDSRLPLEAQVGGSGLEHGIGEVETHNSMDRGTELEPQRLAARGALHEHRRCRGTKAARECSVVELQDEVAAATLERRDRAGDVEAAELIGDRGEAARRDDPHPGQTLLARILAAVAVRIVEDLADRVRAI